MRNHAMSVGVGWVIAFAVLNLLVGGLIYGYKLINEPPPSHDSNRKLELTVVFRGGTLTLDNAFLQEKRCSGWFSRNIYASNGLRILSESEYRPATIQAVGDNFPSKRSFYIPRDAPLGEARYVSIVEWSCNALQRIWPQIEELPELPFIIVEAPHGGI